MKRLAYLIPAISLAVAMLAAHSASAAASAPSVMGTIHGGGTANMTDLVAAGFKGVSSFGFEATLFSDGSARGHFDCVDHMGDLPGCCKSLQRRPHMPRAPDQRADRRSLELGPTEASDLTLTPGGAVAGGQLIIHCGTDCWAGLA